MSEYQKAKMPDYGDGPEPCDDCAIKDKRIAELEEAGRELLIDAMNLYSHYPNNFRNDVKDYFEDEIKVFGLPEGVKE